MKLLITSLFVAELLCATGGPKDHPIRFNGPLTNLQEAPVIGNGDLAALVTITQHEIVFQLGKNDVWDARFDNIAADVVLKEDDLIRYERDYGLTWTGAYGSKPAWRTTPPGLGTIYHRVANVVVGE